MLALGDYSKGFITDIPHDPLDPEAVKLDARLVKLPMEGVYVYSFEKNRMLYAKGWEEVVGVPDDQINMLMIVNLSDEHFAPFVHEINDKALKFLHRGHDRLTEYSFTIELKIKHVQGHSVPVIARVSVFGVDEEGRLASICGRFHVDYGLRFGKVMRYAAYGPEKDLFENDLNVNLFYPFHISSKEMEVLKLLAEGYAYKEIAEKLHISQSAVDKRIQPLYRRFKVRNNAHLVAFAYQNNLPY